MEVKELIVVVPKRTTTTDLNGSSYPFRVKLLTAYNAHSYKDLIVLLLLFILLL